MTRSTITLACLALVLTACGREEAPPAAEPAPAAVAAPAAEAAPAAAPPAAAAPAAFEMRDYAGVFVAGGSRLELGGDGSYRLDEAGAVPGGTWTVEQADTRIRLDPNSKSEPDRVLLMDGRDRLTPVDDAGRPIAGATPWLREPATR